MAYVTTTTVTNTSVFDRARSFFEGVALTVKRRRLYSQTFNGLDALTNRELADLGLHRSCLRQVAREAAYNATS